MHGVCSRVIRAFKVRIRLATGTARLARRGPSSKLKSENISSTSIAAAARSGTAPCMRSLFVDIGVFPALHISLKLGQYGTPIPVCTRLTIGHSARFRRSWCQHESPRSRRGSRAAIALRYRAPKASRAGHALAVTGVGADRVSCPVASELEHGHVIVSFGTPSDSE